MKNEIINQRMAKLVDLLIDENDNYNSPAELLVDLARLTSYKLKCLANEAMDAGDEDGDGAENAMFSGEWLEVHDLFKRAADWPDRY